MTDENTKPQDEQPETAQPEEELTPEEMDEAAGGLLLPAVQKVREAATRLKTD